MYRKGYFWVAFTSGLLTAFLFTGPFWTLGLKAHRLHLFYLSLVGDELVWLLVGISVCTAIPSYWTGNRLLFILSGLVGGTLGVLLVCIWMANIWTFISLPIIVVIWGIIESRRSLNQLNHPTQHH